MPVSPTLDTPPLRPLVVNAVAELANGDDVRVTAL